MAKWMPISVKICLHSCPFFLYFRSVGDDDDGLRHVTMAISRTAEQASRLLGFVALQTHARHLAPYQLRMAFNRHERATKDGEKRGN